MHEALGSSPITKDTKNIPGYGCPCYITSWVWALAHHLSWPAVGGAWHDPAKVLDYSIALVSFTLAEQNN
jgi:hypothetical protein